MEQQVTVPIERALNSAPNVIARRSRTIFGLSVVDLMTGLTAAFALTSGVIGARATGKGMDVDTSLFDTGLQNLSYLATWYLNAGHNPGLLVRAGGEVEQLGSAGLPLGLMAQGQFGARTLELGHGDLLCIYSDGITECEAPDEEEFGQDRLTAILAEHRAQPLAENLHRIDQAVTDFAQGQPQGDDQTVILLRRC